VNSYDSINSILDEISKYSEDLQRAKNKTVISADINAKESYEKAWVNFEGNYIILLRECEHALKALSIGERLKDKNLEVRAKKLLSDYKGYQSSLLQSKNLLQNDYYSAFVQLQNVKANLDEKRTTILPLLKTMCMYYASELKSHPIHFLKGGSIQSYLNEVNVTLADKSLGDKEVEKVAELVEEGYSLKNSLHTLSVFLLVVFGIILMGILATIIYKNKSRKQIE
jgi:hypothetical protein